MTRINTLELQHQPKHWFQQSLSGDDKVNALRSHMTEAELGRDDGFECKRRYGVPVTAQELAPVDVLSASQPGVSPIDRAVGMIDHGDRDRSINVNLAAPQRV